VSPSPPAIDLIQHRHDAARLGRLRSGEQIIGVLAGLAQVQQHDFRLAVGEAGAEYPIQRVDGGLVSRRRSTVGYGRSTTTPLAYLASSGLNMPVRMLTRIFLHSEFCALILSEARIM
jgi:hypothetical protein